MIDEQRSTLQEVRTGCLEHPSTRSDTCPVCGIMEIRDVVRQLAPLIPGLLENKMVRRFMGGS